MSTRAATTATTSRSPRPSAALARLVCFADIGAGEVLSGGHKLVGLTQWRGRQGALVQGCVYRRFHPGPLLDVLAIDPDEREAMAAQLAPAACGWTDAGIVEFTAGDLIRRLRVSGRWDVVDVE